MAANDFLAAEGWADSTRTPLAGDASTRSFTRLERVDGSRAILMQSGGVPVPPFLRAADHLSGLGLSVPRIFATDPDRALVLMEDLGDGLFADLMQADPGSEPSLYAAATDLLITLHRHSVPLWADRYGPEEMTDALDPFLTHCATGDTGPLTDTMRALLTDHAPDTSVLLHRDYHAQNLLWLADREGVARVGLIDFQDALAGHPAYDLVSLLQDARRDVSPEIEEAMLARYIAVAGADDTRFRAAYALQGAQRHLRILGIFARLAHVDGKPQYLALNPRVRIYLDRCLAHPVAAPLRDALARATDA